MGGDEEEEEDTGRMGIEPVPPTTPTVGPVTTLEITEEGTDFTGFITRMCKRLVEEGEGAEDAEEGDGTDDDEDGDGVDDL